MSSYSAFLQCIIFSFVAILLNCHRFIGSTINIFYHFQFSRFSLLFRSGFFTTSNYKYFSRERKREREREREKEKGLDAMQSRERHERGDLASRWHVDAWNARLPFPHHLHLRRFRASLFEDRSSERAGRSIDNGWMYRDRPVFREESRDFTETSVHFPFIPPLRY